VIAFFLQNQHYPSHEEYVAALADAMKQEYDEIHRAGIVLQLDCPDLAMTRAHARRGSRGLPAARAMRMHLCWGNYEGPHHHDVALRDIIDIVFRLRGRQGARRHRAHPGRARLDDELHRASRVVAQRITRFAKLVGPENVMAGSDCGFATFASLLTVDPGITWAKLRAMADGAALASEALY
jgi:5-methyltetrahydropteroyltriglutamate--homocysteine methyltransferase